jgi:hypothetical protein
MRLLAVIAFLAGMVALGIAVAREPVAPTTPEERAQADANLILLLSTQGNE